MKNIIRVIATMVCVAVTGCALPKAENRYTKEWTLHTCGIDQTGVIVAAEPMALYSKHSGNKAWCYPVAETETALKHVVQRGGGDKPLILFVHGRGAHPGKGLSKNLIHYLTYENRANVVMFHWPSYQGLTGYPSESAWASATSLETFLRTAINFKDMPDSPQMGQ